MRGLSRLVPLLLALASAAAAAQGGAAPGAGEGATRPSASEGTGAATTALTDLAAAFDAFDAAYAAASRVDGAASPAVGLDAAARRSFNRRFDALTARFFALDLEGATRDVRALTAELGAPSPAGGRGLFEPGPVLDEATRTWLDAAHLDPADPLHRAARAARSRVRWLEGEASELDRFVLSGPSPPATAADVHAEVARLAAGEDPYRRWRGERDLWRTYAAGRRDLRVRVFCPPELDLDRPVPVVVALHGAGGNEHFFFEAAGDGHLARLAREHGFVAVTPFTPDLVLGPRALDGLLDDLAATYPVDPARVHLVGHSLGGMAVANLCRLRPARIASAVCIAGYGGGGRGVPPTLTLAGELDRIVPAESVRRAAEAARAMEAPVQFELLRDEGHTLLLPRALDRAMAFFFDG